MEALGVISRPDRHGRGGRYYWRLPDNDATYSHLRARMEADVAAQGWHHHETDVPDDEEIPPDEGGNVADVGGVAPSSGVRSSGDSPPFPVVTPDVGKSLQQSRSKTNNPQANAVTTSTTTIRGYFSARQHFTQADRRKRSSRRACQCVSAGQNFDQARKLGHVADPRPIRAMKVCLHDQIPDCGCRYS